ncbi:hypothetical protein B0T26DRAFT_672394 [Lasiosphaeria miniovina]|uniref:Uncharacterized protein n=1 Tax=Lasiosphaeria miniovina TaxID=1954250 RepID=A0AA40B4V1_9PEZI|nr:uncharacterized protein B0T26DRAFT_672394 [Lasiosphaeria miniovina]KAK0727765.1 hypothetical protein B0T26DRAFT_672394 [Lasiosphaeria miniovina]
MLAAAPFSLATVFTPDSMAHDGFVLHSRLVLQLDCLVTFGASFLWLAVYACVDLSRAGAAEGRGWLFAVAVLPVFLACAGPGTAVVVAWFSNGSPAQTRK